MYIFKSVKDYLEILFTIVSIKCLKIYFFFFFNYSITQPEPVVKNVRAPGVPPGPIPELSSDEEDTNEDGEIIFIYFHIIYVIFIMYKYFSS